jgi:hypothetical protein
MPSHRELIERAYAAFNARDVDAALATMHPEVDWPNAIDGGRVRGREELRRYWMRQFETADPRVEPRAIEEDERGALTVEVHQLIRNLQGTVLVDRPVLHEYRFEAGLIRRMDIR